MKKNYININDNEIFDITNYLNKTQCNLSDTKDSSTNKFQSLNKSNLFSSGINKINKQMDIVSKAIYRLNRTIRNKTEEIIFIDKKLSEEAEKIKVPNNFFTNNSINSHIFKQINLSKKEGLNIKDDNSLNESNLNFNANILSENLKNITNQKMDDNNVNLKDNNIKGTTLKNINDKIQTNDIKLYDDIEIKEEYFYDDFFDE